MSRTRDLTEALDELEEAVFRLDQRVRGWQALAFAMFLLALLGWAR